MKVSVELPDLLLKLKRVSYSQYHLEQEEQFVLITLHNGQQSICYQLTHPLSPGKRTEVVGLLEQYRS